MNNGSTKAALVTPLPLLVSHAPTGAKIQLTRVRMSWWISAGLRRLLAPGIRAVDAD